MKTKVITFMTAGILMACLTAFAQQDKDAAAARKDIKEAKEDLREAKLDSASDYQSFKKEAEKKISENKKEIASLKAEKSNDTKEVKEKYDKKVAALEIKNNELKKRIDGSASTKTSKWTIYKHEFNRDMDELGQAIKDLGKKNTM